MRKFRNNFFTIIVFIGFCLTSKPSLAIMVDPATAGTAYAAYFAYIGSGVRMNKLPQYVINKLKPYYSVNLLNAARYGQTSKVHNNNAMTDCKNIYFPSNSGIREVLTGNKLFDDAQRNKLHWLLHELQHASQCDDIGSRLLYGQRWFAEVGWTLVREAITNPAGIDDKSIHDKMPMEADAENKANQYLTAIRGYQWKYSSGGASNWRNLATSGVSLANLRFGDFDGDGKTDVFTKSGNQWKYSSGGASNWRNLATSGVSLANLRFGDFDGDGRTDVYSIVER